MILISFIFIKKKRCKISEMWLLSRTTHQVAHILYLNTTKFDGIILYVISIIYFFISLLLTFHIACKIHKMQTSERESKRVDCLYSATNSKLHLIGLALWLSKFKHCCIILKLVLLHNKPKRITYFCVISSTRKVCRCQRDTQKL